MTAGISVSRISKASGWIPFKFPTRILSLSRSKADRKREKMISEKLSKRCHISSIRALKDIYPYFRIIFQNTIERKEEISRWLDLDREMVNYLSKS